MESLVLSPTSTNQNLIPNVIAVLASPGNVILTGHSGISWSPLVKLSSKTPSIPKGR